MTFDASRTPTLITSRDRLTPLRSLVTWLEEAGHQRIVLVDNDSSFGPPLEYYEQTPHEVLRLGANLGHLAVWEAGVLDRIGHQGMFVVTDPDVVPDKGCPPDAVEHLPTFSSATAM